MLPAASTAIVAIDFSMDAVAIHLHMWHWFSLTLNEHWFGVLYANFSAWFIVLCSSSALRWWMHPLTGQPECHGLLAALGALLGSVLILVLLDELGLQDDAHGGIVWVPIVVVITGALTVVGWGIRVWGARAPRPPVEALLSALAPMIVPFYFHVSFLIMLFVATMAADRPGLVGISLAMLAVSFVLPSALLWHILPVRSTSSSQQLVSNDTVRVKEVTSPPRGGKSDECRP
jgi:hypothetical protein